MATPSSATTGIPTSGPPPVNPPPPAAPPTGTSSGAPKQKLRSVLCDSTSQLPPTLQVLACYILGHCTHDKGVLFKGLLNGAVANAGADGIGLLPRRVSGPAAENLRSALASVVPDQTVLESAISQLIDESRQDRSLVWTLKPSSDYLDVSQPDPFPGKAWVQHVIMHSVLLEGQKDPELARVFTNVPPLDDNIIIVLLADLPYIIAHTEYDLKVGTIPFTVETIVPPLSRAACSSYFALPYGRNHVVLVAPYNRQIDFSTGLSRPTLGVMLYSCADLGANSYCYTLAGFDEGKWDKVIRALVLMEGSYSNHGEAHIVTWACYDAWHNSPGFRAFATKLMAKDMAQYLLVTGGVAGEPSTWDMTQLASSQTLRVPFEGVGGDGVHYTKVLDNPPAPPQDLVDKDQSFTVLPPGTAKVSPLLAGIAHKFSPLGLLSTQQVGDIAQHMNTITTQDDWSGTYVLHSAGATYSGNPPTGIPQGFEFPTSAEMVKAKNAIDALDALESIAPKALALLDMVKEYIGSVTPTATENQIVREVEEVIEIINKAEELLALPATVYLAYGLTSVSAAFASRFGLHDIAKVKLDDFSSKSQRDQSVGTGLGQVQNLLTIYENTRRKVRRSLPEVFTAWTDETRSTTHASDRSTKEKTRANPTRWVPAPPPALGGGTPSAPVQSSPSGGQPGATQPPGVTGHPTPAARGKRDTISTRIPGAAGSMPSGTPQTGGPPQQNAPPSSGPRGTTPAPSGTSAPAPSSSPLDQLRGKAAFSAFRLGNPLYMDPAFDYNAPIPPRQVSPSYTYVDGSTLQSVYCPPPFRYDGPRDVDNYFPPVESADQTTGDHWSFLTPDGNASSSYFVADEDDTHELIYDASFHHFRFTSRQDDDTIDPKLRGSFAGVYNKDQGDVDVTWDILAQNYRPNTLTGMIAATIAKRSADTTLYPEPIPSVRHAFPPWICKWTGAQIPQCQFYTAALDASKFMEPTPTQAESVGKMFRIYVNQPGLASSLDQLISSDGVVVDHSDPRTGRAADVIDMLGVIPSVDIAENIGDLRQIFIDLDIDPNPWTHAHPTLGGIFLPLWDALRLYQIELQRRCFAEAFGVQAANKLFQCLIGEYAPLEAVSPNPLDFHFHSEGRTQEFVRSGSYDDIRSMQNLFLMEFLAGLGWVTGVLVLATYEEDPLHPAIDPFIRGERRWLPLHLETLDMDHPKYTSIVAYITTGFDRPTNALVEQAMALSDNLSDMSLKIGDCFLDMYKEFKNTYPNLPYSGIIGLVRAAMSSSASPGNIPRLITAFVWSSGGAIDAGEVEQEYVDWVDYYLNWAVSPVQKEQLADFWLSYPVTPFTNLYLIRATGDPYMREIGAKVQEYLHLAHNEGEFIQDPHETDPTKYSPQDMITIMGGSRPAKDWQAPAKIDLGPVATISNPVIHLESDRITLLTLQKMRVADNPDVGQLVLQHPYEGSMANMEPAPTGHVFVLTAPGPSAARTLPLPSASSGVSQPAATPAGTNRFAPSGTSSSLSASQASHALATGQGIPATGQPASAASASRPPPSQGAGRGTTRPQPSRSPGGGTANQAGAAGSGPAPPGRSSAAGGSGGGGGGGGPGKPPRGGKGPDKPSKKRKDDKKKKGDDKGSKKKPAGSDDSDRGSEDESIYESEEEEGTSAGYFAHLADMFKDKVDETAIMDALLQLSEQGEAREGFTWEPSQEFITRINLCHSVMAQGHPGLDSNAVDLINAMSKGGRTITINNPGIKIASSALLFSAYTLQQAVAVVTFIMERDFYQDVLTMVDKVVDMALTRFCTAFNSLGTVQGSVYTLVKNQHEIMSVAVAVGLLAGGIGTLQNLSINNPSFLRTQISALIQKLDGAKSIMEGKTMIPAPLLSALAKGHVGTKTTALLPPRPDVTEIFAAIADPDSNKKHLSDFGAVGRTIREAAMGLDSGDCWRPETNKPTAALFARWLSGSIIGTRDPQSRTKYDLSKIPDPTTEELVNIYYAAAFSLAWHVQKGSPPSDNDIKQPGSSWNTFRGNVGSFRAGVPAFMSATRTPIIFATFPNVNDMSIEAAALIEELKFTNNPWAMSLAERVAHGPGMSTITLTAEALRDSRLALMMFNTFPDQYRDFQDILVHVRSLGSTIHLKPAQALKISAANFPQLGYICVTYYVRKNSIKNFIMNRNLQKAYPASSKGTVQSLCDALIGGAEELIMQCMKALATDVRSSTAQALNAFADAPTPHAQVVVRNHLRRERKPKKEKVIAAAATFKAQLLEKRRQEAQNSATAVALRQLQLAQNSSLLDGGVATPGTTLGGGVFAAETGTPGTTYNIDLASGTAQPLIPPGGPSANPMAAAFSTLGF